MPARQSNVHDKYMREKIGRSQARAAAKSNITQQYASKLLLCKTSLKYWRREKTPGDHGKHRKKNKNKDAEGSEWAI